MPVCLVSLNLTFVIEEDDFILIEFNLLFGEKHFLFFFCFFREKLMTLHCIASCIMCTMQCFTKYNTSWPVDGTYPWKEEQNIGRRLRENTAYDFVAHKCTDFFIKLYLEDRSLFALIGGL